MEAQKESIEAIPNLLKVFSRNGKILYIQDIRAAVYPLHVIIINGILTGLIIVLFPLVLYFILEFSFVILARFRGLQNYYEIAINYIGYSYKVLLLMAVLGPPAAFFRRFCVSHNLSFSRQVDGDTEFRIGGEELALTVLFTGSLFIISETARYFNFGRYLLISSSRPGTRAANLQGIWNNRWLPPWDSKYTININLEMNYWPAEICNLPETHEPLFSLIEKMKENGQRTACLMYDAGGFCAHHNTDIWGDTAPQGTYIPASYWAMGGVWLCTHLWEHYLFTQDLDFLEKVYPILKAASKFLFDYLIEDEKGRLVTAPSVSPKTVIFYRRAQKPPSVWDQLWILS